MKQDNESRKIILVIEDDDLIRQNIIEVLQEEGYQTNGFENGHAALQYLQTAATMPSLILLDLMMPVMSGWQFRTEQERDSKLKEIPVVVVTADGNARQKATKMNAKGWVRKPIEIDALLTTVETCCAVGSN